VKDIYPKERSKDAPLSQTKTNVVSYNDVFSKQNIQITFESEFELDEQVMFLIIAWKYKCEGIEDIRTDSAHVHWFVKDGKAVGWRLNNYLGEDHREVVQSKKDELIQYLKQEENN
jgi:hypothetical protein